jgi:RNA polymerase sigma-70 factor (sigma-E family)
MEVVHIEAGSTSPCDWDAVAQRVSPALLRLALMLTGEVDAAEDLFQATFARASRHGARIASMEAPAAYLRRVMVNEHTSRRRPRRIQTLSVADLPERPADDRDGLGERDEVWRWLATLPRQQRAALVLRFYEDLPDDEIADLLGCSRATVRSHASHGLAALRSLLTAHEEES